jgi:hypothetical protein
MRFLTPCSLQPLFTDCCWDVTELDQQAPENCKTTNHEREPLLQAFVQEDLPLSNDTSTSYSGSGILIARLCYESIRETGEKLIDEMQLEGLLAVFVSLSRHCLQHLIASPDYIAARSEDIVWLQCGKKQE